MIALTDWPRNTQMCVCGCPKNRHAVIRKRDKSYVYTRCKDTRCSCLEYRRAEAAA